MVIIAKIAATVFVILLAMSNHADTSDINSRSFSVPELTRSKRHGDPAAQAGFGPFGSHGYYGLFPNHSPYSSGPFSYFGPSFWGQQPEYDQFPNYFDPPDSSYSIDYPHHDHGSYYHHYPHEDFTPNRRPDYPHEYPRPNQYDQNPHKHSRPNKQDPLEKPPQNNDRFPNQDSKPNQSGNFPNRPQGPSVGSFPDIDDYPDQETNSNKASTTEQNSILGKPVIVPDAVVPTEGIIFNNTSTETAEQKQCVQDCTSNSNYEPVCGTNGVTYFNSGKFKCARDCGVDVFIKFTGRCPGPTSQSGGY